MLFSVIVPFLNEEKYIRRSLEALINQDFDRKEYELIFVDNGSTDGSNAIVSQFGGVTLLREEGGGAYRARNRGIKAAKGDIIAFTDADCAVSKDWLSQIYGGMADPGITIIFGRINVPQGGSAALKMFEDYLNAKIEYLVRKGLKKFYYGFTNNMAVRADVFRKLGPFSEDVGSGDTEMVRRCLERYPDCKVAYSDLMVAEHLEISGIGVYQRKMYGYGKDSILVGKAGNYAPLGFKERFAIYRYCCKKNKYNILTCAMSILVLIMVFLYFEYGRLIKNWSDRCGSLS
jgi:glycosyltransferase involved in cell wall biosynthesis